MRFLDYDKYIFTEEDILKYEELFNKDIAKQKAELSNFLIRAGKRVNWLNQCERDGNYSVRGRLYKIGKNKEILLIIRYEDGTQRDGGLFCQSQSSKGGTNCL